VRDVIELARKPAKLAALVALAMVYASCSGFGPTSGGVGGTPPEPPESTFKLLGAIGTPFVATVSNSRSSWDIRGSVPLTIVIVHNLLPARMVATKLSSDHALLSLEATRAFSVVAYSSTSAPFGIAQVQMSGTVDPLPPSASPDIRIFVKGPAAERFQGLLEDDDTAFIVQSRVPTLFLFDTPNGKVSGQFEQIQKLGAFSVNLSVDGSIVAKAAGEPKVTIRQP